MKISPTFPSKYINLNGIGDDNVVNALQGIVRMLTTIHESATKVINFNEIIHVSQTSQPVPVEGQCILWVDTTGTATTPKAHIVIKSGGSVYTFSSKEVY